MCPTPQQDHQEDPWKWEGPSVTSLLRTLQRPLWNREIILITKWNQDKFTIQNQLKSLTCLDTGELKDKETVTFVKVSLSSYHQGRLCDCFTSSNIYFLNSFSWFISIKFKTPLKHIFLKDFSIIIYWWITLGRYQANSCCHLFRNNPLTTTRGQQSCNYMAWIW